MFNMDAITECLIKNDCQFEIRNDGHIVLLICPFCQAEPYKFFIRMEDEHCSCKECKKEYTFDELKKEIGDTEKDEKKVEIKKQYTKPPSKIKKHYKPQKNIWEDFKMPCSEKSEEIVIGYLLLNQSIFEKIKDYLHFSDFYHDKNKLIYQTMHEMKGSFDLVTLKDELHKKSRLQEVGGSIRLVNLLNYVVEGMNYKIHIEEIIKTARLREIINFSYSNIEKASNDGDFEGISENTKSISNLLRNKDPDRYKIQTLHDLDLMKFTEPKWIIPNVIPEGLSILAGKPKSGKSNMALGLSLSVATGGKALSFFPVDRRGVLYLALEDSPRRLRGRSRALISPNESLPDNFHYVSSNEGWPKLPEAADKIMDFIQEKNDIGLVIIDTFQKIRKQRNRYTDPYQTDYEDIAMIKEVADFYNIGIIIVHHQRKMASEDIFDTVSGTFGITGGADTILILKREGRSRADSILHVTGRDVEDTEIALRSEKRCYGDASAIMFEYMGHAEEYRLSKERQEIIDILKKSVTPMTPKEIAELLDKKDNNVRRLLNKMCNNNEIKNTEYGKYHIL
jgi:replicative DNA helicase